MSHINFELLINREELTNIAIDVVLDVGVVRPDDSIEGSSGVLDKQADTE